MVDPLETEHCSCGGTGHLNQIASVPGILHYARKFLQEDKRPSVLREKEDFDGADLTDAAKEGDAIAMKTLDYCMGHLARGLAIAAHIIDPDIFLIGGGMAKAGQLLIDVIQKHYVTNHYLTKEETPEEQQQAEEPVKKPRYIKNPLPLPKKHVRRQMDYQYTVDDKDMNYDVEVGDDDDFDL